MAENEWPPRADVVNVLVAIRIPEVGAPPANHEWRVATYRAKGAHRRIHAPGNHLLGAFLQFARLLEFAGHGSSSAGTYKYSSGNSGAAGGVTCPCDTGNAPSPKPRDSPKIYNLATILKHTAGTLALVTYPPNREGPGQLRGLRAVHSFWQPRRTPQGQVVLVVGRSRLPFGRWRAQLSAGKYCRGLLQRSRVARDFRRLRSAAHQQSRLQPRSWTCAGGGFRFHLEF